MIDMHGEQLGPQRFDGLAAQLDEGMKQHAGIQAATVSNPKSFGPGGQRLQELAERRGDRIVHPPSMPATIGARNCGADLVAAGIGELSTGFSVSLDEYAIILRCQRPPHCFFLL
ncbi:MAG: hypothetical protein AB7V26_02335 [Lysobacterales bacterium]